MSPKYALGIAFYIGSRVLANPIVHHPGDNVSSAKDQLIKVYPASDPLPFKLAPTSALNGSPTLLNVTSSTDVHIQCDGASYGFDLDISDCGEAEAYFPIHADQVQWAERHTGSQKQIFPLPYRAMGDKASCYVQPVLIDGATSAKAAPNEVRNAAAMIRDRCASGGKLQGGIATNIGGDNNLAVIMGAYKSPSAVQCFGVFALSRAYQNILEDMPATTKMEGFGLSENSSATVLLPLTIMQGNRRIDGSSATLTLGNSVNVALDTGSWYEVWEATIALWSVCTRHRMGGFIGSMGEFP